MNQTTNFCARLLIMPIFTFRLSHLTFYHQQTDSKQCQIEFQHFCMVNHVQMNGNENSMKKGV